MCRHVWRTKTDNLVGLHTGFVYEPSENQNWNLLWTKYHFNESKCYYVMWYYFIIYRPRFVYKNSPDPQYLKPMLDTIFIIFYFYCLHFLPNKKLLWKKMLILMCLKICYVQSAVAWSDFENLMAEAVIDWFRSYTCNLLWFPYTYRKLLATFKNHSNWGTSLVAQC